MLPTWRFLAGEVHLSLRRRARMSRRFSQKRCGDDLGSLEDGKRFLPNEQKNQETMCPKENLNSSKYIPPPRHQSSIPVRQRKRGGGQQSIGARPDIVNQRGNPLAEAPISKKVLKQNTWGVAVYLGERRLFVRMLRNATSFSLNTSYITDTGT